MIRSPTAHLAIRLDSTPHLRIWGMSCFVSAIPTRHWNGAARQSLRLGGWLIRRLWLGTLATGIRLRLLVGDNAALGEWVDQLVTVTQQLAFVPVQLRRKPALPRPFDDPQGIV